MPTPNGKDERLNSGVARLIRPWYAAHLLQEWLPALDGVVDRLRAGASVADVECRFGASTVLMAGAFTRSTFAGFDSHRPFVEAALLVVEPRAGDDEGGLAGVLRAAGFALVQRVTETESTIILEARP